MVHIRDNLGGEPRFRPLSLDGFNFAGDFARNIGAGKGVGGSGVLTERWGTHWGQNWGGDTNAG